MPSNSRLANTEVNISYSYSVLALARGRRRSCRLSRAEAFTVPPAHGTKTARAPAPSAARRPFKPSTQRPSCLDISIHVAATRLSASWSFFLPLLPNRPCCPAFSLLYSHTVPRKNAPLFCEEFAAVHVIVLHTSVPLSLCTIFLPERDWSAAAAAADLGTSFPPHRQLLPFQRPRASVSAVPRGSRSTRRWQG